MVLTRTSRAAGRLAANDQSAFEDDQERRDTRTERKRKETRQLYGVRGSMAQDMCCDRSRVGVCDGGKSAGRWVGGRRRAGNGRRASLSSSAHVVGIVTNAAPFKERLKLLRVRVLQAGLILQLREEEAGMSSAREESEQSCSQWVHTRVRLVCIAVTSPASHSDPCALALFLSVVESFPVSRVRQFHQTEHLRHWMTLHTPGRRDMKRSEGGISKLQAMRGVSACCSSSWCRSHLSL